MPLSQYLANDMAVIPKPLFVFHPFQMDHPRYPVPTHVCAISATTCRIKRCKDSKVVKLNRTTATFRVLDVRAVVRVVMKMAFAILAMHKTRRCLWKRCCGHRSVPYWVRVCCAVWCWRPSYFGNENAR